MSAIFVHNISMKIETKNQAEKLINKPFIDRSIHADLYKSLQRREVTVLYGARQVGKSTEVLKLISVLFDDTTPKDIFYFNLDIISEDFKNPDSFINSIFAQKSDAKTKTYIFIDEAQRLDNVGLFVKYIYDSQPDIKIMLTGSASLDIKQKIKEPLTGRKTEYYLSPLSLKEILVYNGMIPSNLSGNFEAFNTIMENYLLYGGYPQVVILQDESLKKQKLLEISESYILRDIADLFGINNTDNLRLVATYLAENVGNVLSKDNLCKYSGLTKHEVEKCLNALQKSFILNLVKPFAKDRSKELIHRPKIYFQDLGIRNATLKKLDRSLIVADKGALFENAVLLALEKPTVYMESVGYWRTSNQTEVDFVVSKEGGRVSAYECKYSYDGESLPKNLKSFGKTYADIVDEVKVVSMESFWEVLRK